MYYILIAKRGAFGEERYEKIDFQIKVREKFMALKEIDAAQRKIPWHVLVITTN